MRMIFSIMNIGNKCFSSFNTYILSTMRESSFKNGNEMMNVIIALQIKW